MTEAAVCERPACKEMVREKAPAKKVQRKRRRSAIKLSVSKTTEHKGQRQSAAGESGVAQSGVEPRGLDEAELTSSALIVDVANNDKHSNKADDALEKELSQEKEQKADAELEKQIKDALVEQIKDGLKEKELEKAHESTIELGKKGEEAAVRYLISQHYDILERNWRCPFGEADIIAKDQNGTICFIEVKTRRSIKTGLPEESVTKSKRARYEKIAMCYMMDTDIEDNTILRFDAIGICVADPKRAMLRHHKSWFCE